MVVFFYTLAVRGLLFLQTLFVQGHCHERVKSVPSCSTATTFADGTWNAATKAFSTKVADGTVIVATSSSPKSLPMTLSKRLSHAFNHTNFLQA
jgi:hypothetical protein